MPGLSWRRFVACAEEVTESFFATLKKELIRDRALDTRDTARAEVFEYIEVFYNRQRAHSLLSYETPDAFEDCFEKKNAAKALATRPANRGSFSPRTPRAYRTHAGNTDCLGLER